MRSKSIVLLALSLLPLAAPAAEVGRAGITDLTGPRAMGLGAAIGIASGNDAIYVNPGALAARKRYSAVGSFYLERRGSESTEKVFSASIVDGLSSSVAAAAAYGQATDGEDTGKLFHLGFAGTLTSGLYLGASGKYYDLSGRESVSAATADVGILWEVTSFMAVGAAGYNLIPTSHPYTQPRGVGAGISIGTDTLVHGMFDWRANLDTDGKTTNRYSLGVEALLGDTAPVRAGYVIDETLDTRWWTVGIGLISAQGGAIDFAYRQSVTDTDARVLSVSVGAQFAQ